MRSLSIGLHGFFLAILNIASILMGFTVYHLIRPANQIAMQLPIAMLLTMVGVCIWRFLAFKDLAIRQISGFGKIWITALLWCPVIGVTLHYFTQGYLTSFGNIVAVWTFQIIANSLAFLIAEVIWTTVRKKACD